MSLSEALYGDVRLQYKTAKYRSVKVNDVRENGKNGLLNPDGEKYTYSKNYIYFRCGIFEGKKMYGINLLEGITVTDGTIVLLSVDKRAMDIKRGDRVTFENEEFTVIDAHIQNIIKRNSQFQRRTNNQMMVITLT